MASSGPAGFWRLSLARSKRLAAETYVPQYDIAEQYALLGDRDAAFAWLEKANQERSASLVGLKMDASFDSLRSDPRFPRVLRLVGFS